MMERVQSREPLTKHLNDEGDLVYEPPLPEVMPELPMTVRVRRRRWVWSLLFGLVGSLFVPWLLIASAGGGGSAMLWVFRLAAVAVWPLAVLLLVHACQAVFRPRHIMLDAQRVWTRDWSLDWVDVLEVDLLPNGWLEEDMWDAPNHKQRVGLYIGGDVHREKVGTGNRWDSGYPFGLGGAAPMHGAVYTQYDTVPPIRDVYLVMKVLQRNARDAAGLESTPPRIYRPQHMGPIS